MEKHRHSRGDMFVIRRLNKSCYERQEGNHPARSPLHCFFYLSEGSVLVDIDDATYFIQEDDLVIIPAGQMFKVRYYENSKGYMGGFHNSLVEPSGAGENSMTRLGFLRIWGNPKFALEPTGSAGISALMERLCLEYEKDTPDIEIIKAYLSAFVAEISAIYKQSNQESVKHNGTICNKFLELLFHNKDISVKEAASKLSVAYYAQKLSITPNHLNKVVKGVTGKSPSLWIEEAVILEAKRLLRTTHLSLGEIAGMVGILDQSYFARRFKKHEGISPREYRNLLNK